MSAPIILYPNGDTVDIRRWWVVALNDATRTSIQAVIYTIGGVDLVYDTRMVSIVSAGAQNSIRIAADCGMVPGVTYELYVRAGNSGVVTAWSAQALVIAKLVDLYRPLSTYEAWREGA